MSSFSIAPVNVFEAARTGRSVQGELPLAAFARLGPTLLGAGTVRYAFDCARDDRGRPSAQLTFEAVVVLRCDRCNGPVRLPLNGAAWFYFVRTEDELARIPVDESDEEPLIGSERFDLHALIEDELILALPISPKHEDCSLPVDVDGAVAEPAADPAPDRPNPFAKLAQFKPRRH